MTKQQTKTASKCQHGRYTNSKQLEQKLGGCRFNPFLAECHYQTAATKKQHEQTDKKQ
jgi:hypothetical protein